MTAISALAPSDTLFPVLDLLRTEGSVTRTELAFKSGLTRKVVAQRVEELISAGFAEEGDVARSTGGRAPREVRFRADAAIVLVVELAANSITAGVTDLAGSVLAELRTGVDPNDGPEATMSRVEDLLDRLIADRPVDGPPIYGVGIGIPGPVATGSGRPIGALSVPEWAGYPVRDRLAARYDVPVWVGNDANLMALGEHRSGVARGHDDVLFIKVGRGIGGAVISDGSLRRGSQGFAGEFGHVIVAPELDEICWCGQTGCLTQVSGARAIARQAQSAADRGESAILAAIMTQGRKIGAREVFTAAAAGDPISAGILHRAGTVLGSAVSVLVSALNPSLILVDAGLVTVNDPFMAAFEATVREKSLRNATRDLAFAISPLGNSAGLVGAAQMVVDGLLSRRSLALWSGNGTPVGMADVIHTAR